MTTLATVHRQRGIALITALLVVSLAVIASTAVVVAGHIAIHRTATLAETERAWWYAVGVEDWVRTILERDAKDNQFDGMTDDWAQPIDYLPVDEGFLRGQVVDLQGRFNLNNFALVNPQDRAPHQQIFERLLSSLEGVDPYAAQILTKTIVDWVDSNQEPEPPEGAEDNEYLSLSPPYRAANRMMESPTELLAIKGMTRELYQKLAPYVAALPQAGTKININTAPEPLLRAMVESNDPMLDEFLERRIEEPSEKTDGVDLPAFVNDAPIAVQSDFFMLQAEATIGNSRVALYSLIHRPQGGAPVVLAHSMDSE